MLNVLSSGRRVDPRRRLRPAGHLPDLLVVQGAGSPAPNPWGAKGLEWETASPPPTENFEETPIVTTPAYAYTQRGRRMSEVHAALAAGTATSTTRGCSTTSTRWSSSSTRRTFGMWVFLVTEVLFFGGLFMAYILYRIWYPEMFVAASHAAEHPARRLQHRGADRQQLTMALRCARRRRGEQAEGAGRSGWSPR